MVDKAELVIIITVLAAVVLEPLLVITELFVGIWDYTRKVPCDEPLAEWLIASGCIHLADLGLVMTLYVLVIVNYRNRRLTVPILAARTVTVIASIVVLVLGYVYVVETNTCRATSREALTRKWWSSNISILGQTLWDTAIIALVLGSMIVCLFLTGVIYFGVDRVIKWWKASSRPLPEFPPGFFRVSSQALIPGFFPGVTSNDSAAGYEPVPTEEPDKPDADDQKAHRA